MQPAALLENVLRLGDLSHAVVNRCSAADAETATAVAVCWTKPPTNSARRQQQVATEVANVAGRHDPGQRQSSRTDQRQRPATPRVSKTNQGSFARCGPSAIPRQICARVIRPNTTPVVIT